MLPLFNKLSNHYRLIIAEREKGRIPYIDLIKGFAIICVVYIHIVGNYSDTLPIRMMNNLRMPLFVFMSGFFFKEYGGFRDFATRKICKILIPFFFFLVLFWICRPISLLIHPLKHVSSGFSLDMLMKSCETPIWFLACLFCICIFFYDFQQLTRKWHFVAKLVVLTAIGAGAYYAFPPLQNYIARYNGDVAQYYILFQPILALALMPLYFIAVELKKSGLAQKRIHPFVRVAIFAVGITLWILCAQQGIELKHLHLGKNLLFFYISALGGIAVVWSVMSLLVWLPYVSYLGRYSIIILGSHMSAYIIAAPLCHWKHTPIIIVMAILCPIIIAVFKHFLPYLCAQKDLLVLGADNYMHFAPEVKSRLKRIFRKNSSK